MRMPLAISLIAGVVLAGLLTLLLPPVRLALLRSPAVQPVVMQTLGNYTDTDSHAKYFFYLVRLHQYAEARSLLSPRAKASLSAPALQAQWAAFESVHGRVMHWTEAGGTTNLLPTYVDRRYQVSGSHGGSALVTLRLIRPAGSPDDIRSWQVDALTLAR